MVQHEGYYDYMLRRLREEGEDDNELRELDFTDSPHGGVSSSGSIVRREMYEMQKVVHALQIRVKELSAENKELRELIVQRIEVDSGKESLGK